MRTAHHEAYQQELCPAAGLPPNNNTLLCPNASSSCYVYIGSPAAYATQKAGCTSRGGTLVAYNTAAEQLAVELYFWNVTKVMGSTATVYIGIEQVGYQW
jgi:hypothetical protein